MPKHNKDKNSSEEGMSNFSQTDKKKQKFACYCCGNEMCRLSNCTKKATLLNKKWDKPKYYVKPSDQSNAQTTDFAGGTCQSRSCCKASTVVFSGMQVHSIVEKKEPEMMLDSGLTITLRKDRSLFTSLNNLEQNVQMNTNGGPRKIDKEGCWREYSHAYYMFHALMNIVLLSDAIRKEFSVFMDSSLDNTFYVTDAERRTVRFSCNDQGLYTNESGRTF